MALSFIKSTFGRPVGRWFLFSKFDKPAKLHA